jgi:hypothetical protein
MYCWKHATSYWETAISGLLVCNVFTPLPAYTVPACAKPAVLNPGGKHYPGAKKSSQD